MSSSVLYMSMSVDGYIAGPNDEPGQPRRRRLHAAARVVLSRTGSLAGHPGRPGRWPTR